MAIGSIFISHKHRDVKIATVVAKFLRDVSGNRVAVYLSSNPRFNGPRAGGNLDEELQRAIGDSGVMLLVYTGRSEKLDWSYCMYECGLASSRGMRLIVMQCADEAPAPFLDKVRTKATDKSDLHKFTKEFMTSIDFFPNQKDKVTEYGESDPAIENKASEFHQRLNQAIEEVICDEPQEWSAWASLDLKLETDTIKSMRDAPQSKRLESISNQIRTEATVADSKGTDRVFGLGIDKGMVFQSVIQTWQESHPDEELDWLDSICEQIEAFTRRGFPVLREARIAEVMGSARLVPIVTRQLTFPNSDAIELRIAFYNIHPRSPRVTKVMIKKQDMHYLELDNHGASGKSLKEIYKDLKGNDITRLPVLSNNGHIEFMVHRSIISEFLLESTSDAPTIDDLLHAPELSQMLQSSFVFVDKDATLEEARSELKSVPGARDIFVTDGGDKEEPILGMLANTDLEEMQDD